MNNLEEIKKLLNPIVVAQHYLGQGKKRGNKIWYKSPFRTERTASFFADEESFHDFGDNWHGDIFNFIERYYNTDFINAIRILSRDFGLPEDEPMSKDLEKYLKRRREEEIKIKQHINNWYVSTFCMLCDELHIWQKTILHVRGEALSVAYKKEQYLEYLVDLFIDATEQEKAELWKHRKEIEKIK